MNDGRRMVVLVMSAAMICVTPWPRRDSRDGWRSSDVTGFAPAAQASTFAWPKLADAGVSAEVVALRADELRRVADVLADVVVAGRREDAEAVEEPGAESPLLRIGVRQALAEQRQKIAPGRAFGQRRRPDEVVRAGAAQIDVVARDVEQFADHFDGLRDAVAETDAADLRVAMDGETNAVLGVGVVEEQRAGRQPLDILRDGEHRRDGAERVRESAGAAVLAEDAREAVLERELVVGLPRAVAIDGDRRDDVVSTGEGFDTFRRRAKA